MQNRKSNKKMIHIHGNYMHKSGLQVQARFRSALKPGSHGQLNFTLNVQLSFQLYLLNNMTDQVVLPITSLLLLQQASFVILVCKTLKGEVGPKEEKKISFLFLSCSRQKLTMMHIVFTNYALG